ncbi:MAG: 23S rRNA (pseudouridine(1915)-N(3))-methyltransferase RlmH [Bacilli bacterium]|nr:23S rRNA (pseudouridine(1915)-N(3))-methyltransferase RlmH [Bacilli bacterium]
MIKIIWVGKIKETSYKEAVDEYLKRLSRYTKIQAMEIADEKGDNQDRVLGREKDRILSKIKDRDYLVVLDRSGDKFDSIGLADKINSILLNHNVTFVIGSSHGLHNIIIKRANLKLSFSDLTFPHQLFRVIFLEQLYRAFKIINNETYHK